MIMITTAFASGQSTTSMTTTAKTTPATTMAATTYELTVICAAGPLPEDPKESYVYIEDVTLFPVKVNTTYGTEPIIVWDGTTFKQLSP